MSLFRYCLISMLMLACGDAVISAGAIAGENRPQSQPAVERRAVLRGPVGPKWLRSPLAIARDAKTGDLLVTSSGTEELVIIDQAGNPLNRLGKNAGLVTPYGVALDGEGLIYVTELKTGMLKVLSPGGLLIEPVDLSALAGRKVSPGRLTLGSDGTAYIVDLAENAILVLNPKHDALRILGSFQYLQKAAPAANGGIIALSAMGTAVTLMDAEGKVASAFGEHGEESSLNFSFPTSFALDAKGRIWIADAFQHRLKVFTSQGELLFNYGRLEEEATGGFFFPVDLCFGINGELFVLEKGAGRIQTFQVSDLKEEGAKPTMESSGTGTPRPSGGERIQ